MAPVTTIGFDADDTLWQNLRFYGLSEERFTALLADYAEGPNLTDRINAVERRNLAIYGYGIKSFTLSLIETALEVTDGRLPAKTIEQILAIGREMLVHPVDLLPHAESAIRALKEHHRLVLITKGDLFDQERKIAASGLADSFDAIEIVSEKDTNTYRRIFSRHGDGPQRAVMVGNSLKSDIVPALDAGSFSVYVPHEIDWALEEADEPITNPRYRRIRDLGELPTTISGLPL